MPEKGKNRPEKGEILENFGGKNKPILREKKVNLSMKIVVFVSFFRDDFSFRKQSNCCRRSNKNFYFENL